MILYLFLKIIYPNFYQKQSLNLITQTKSSLFLQQQFQFVFNKKYHSKDKTLHSRSQQETIEQLKDVAPNIFAFAKNMQVNFQLLEGRDKLTKTIIYLFKLIDAVRSIYHQNNTYKFQKIAYHLQKARQFMRLAKFIQEFSIIIKLMKQPTKDEYRRLMQIIIHTFFSFYWVFDNLSLLSAFNIIKIPQYELNQTAMTIKVIAMTIAAIINLRNWIKLHHEEIKAKRMLKILKGQENLKKNVELLDLIHEQWKTFLLCLKIYGDICPTFAKSTFAKRTLKLQIPRIIQALGGLLNALVSCFLTSF